MSVFKDKNILIGITGGIAAYKTPILVRHFIKAGAHVKVIMTPASKDFVTPLTLSTLSKNPVLSDFTSEDNENDVWNNHVDLGLWADYFIVAPATANTLFKMANGNCDNFLLAVYLSAKCPVYFAPAMDLDMYKHGSTDASLTKLLSFGNKMIPSTEGELASGLVGYGRMAEPEDIFSFIEKDVLSQLPLLGKNVLVTAGPTHEPIDPVRFIGNRSSGKMGFEIANEAAKLGANVTLISGPSHLKPEYNSIKRLNVVTAAEMYNAVHNHYLNSDIVVMAAAVADYSPKEFSNKKIKKKSSEFVIELNKTKDILKSLGEQKKQQYLVGFALETDNEDDNAKQKLAKKNLDLIVLNSLNDKGAGFDVSTNKVTFFTKSEVLRNELKSKKEVSEDLFKFILKEINA